MPKYTEQQMQKAINHARKEPTVPRARIAALYEVNVTTLKRRLAGVQVSSAAAHRHDQLFTPGEERAIAEHCGVMADLGFPISHSLIKQVAQEIVNSRKQPPKVKGGSGHVGKDGSTSKAGSSEDSEIHTVGANWVERFLRRNPEFKKQYTRYQERTRKAASSSEESQSYFLHILANLVRRHKVLPENLWSCDEKGITVGQSQVPTAAIVRQPTKKATAEGGHEFCSVLDTANAAGFVIPPFIVVGSKTHGESSYDSNDTSDGRHTTLDATRDATFAVSEGGHMNDELGIQYISEHFEPHTRPAAGRPRILIVNGHSSHICWPVVQYALDHNIHIIQLPSKSTQMLQPLDVGCFAPLQTSYKRHFEEWLLKNPQSLIQKADFLELLFIARTEIYTVDTVKDAWGTSGCWPIDVDKARGVPPPPPAILVEPAPDSSNLRALDTPLLIRKLAREAEQKLFSDDVDKETKRSLFQSLVDITTAKITTYRDIAPRVAALNKLRSGKIRRASTNRGSKQIGNARVLSRKVLNEGLKQLELAETAKAEREHAARVEVEQAETVEREEAARKLAAEEQKRAKQALEQQWKLDFEAYTVQVTAWREECTAIEAAWREQCHKSQTAHKRAPKKPALPTRPKRPSKPKGGDIRDPTVLLGEVEPSEGVEAGAHLQIEQDNIQHRDSDDEDLVDVMGELELDGSAEML